MVLAQQKLPGLWNIPASMHLYPIGEMRSRIVAHQSRLDRFQKGMEAAARSRGVFHFCLNPVNLAESPRGYKLFDCLLEKLATARQAGDISILTMAQLSGQMEALAESQAQTARPPRCPDRCSARGNTKAPHVQPIRADVTNVISRYRHMPTVILARKASASTAIPAGSHITATEYLHQIGIPRLLPCTAPYDPGYDSSTVEGHLDQSASLMEILKISVACWIIADENVTRRKVAAAAAHSVPTVTGNGLFQIAVAQGLVEQYLDLCADFGVTRVECGESLNDAPL